MPSETVTTCHEAARHPDAPWQYQRRGISGNRQPACSCGSGVTGERP